MRMGQTGFSHGRLASAFALLCGAVLAVNHANAQTGYFPAGRGPSILPVGFLSGGSDCLSSSCTSAGCADGCGSGCADGCSSACGDGCSSLLDGCCGCKGGLLSDIDFGGWLAWGYYDNSHGIDSASGAAPLGFNNIPGMQLNQAWTYLGKEAETGNGLDWGFRADFMFGCDGPDTAAFGDGSWDFNWTTSSQYAFAFPQLYGEVAIGNTKIKAGKFYTIIGYEVVQAPDNFFYSHVYTFYYNEPFTHSGVLAESALGDNVSVYYGWTAGWDTGFDNRNDGSVFLGGVSTS